MGGGMEAGRTTEAGRASRRRRKPELADSLSCGYLLASTHGRYLAHHALSTLWSWHRDWPCLMTQRVDAPDDPARPSVRSERLIGWKAESAQALPTVPLREK